MEENYMIVIIIIVLIFLFKKDIIEGVASSSSCYNTPDNEKLDQKCALILNSDCPTTHAGENGCTLGERCQAVGPVCKSIKEKETCGFFPNSCEWGSTPP